MKLIFNFDWDTYMLAVGPIYRGFTYMAPHRATTLSRKLGFMLDYGFIIDALREDETTTT